MRFGKERLHTLRLNAEPMIREGLLEHLDGHFRIPAERLLLSDRVIGSLFDL